MLPSPTGSPGNGKADKLMSSGAAMGRGSLCPLAPGPPSKAEAIDLMSSGAGWGEACCAPCLQDLWLEVEIDEVPLGPRLVAAAWFQDAYTGDCTVSS